MRLIEEIFKKDSIDLKYLLKILKKKLLLILSITFILFSLFAFFFFQKLNKEYDVRVYFNFEKNIKIMNERYRKAISNNTSFRKFVNDFLIDFYKYYTIHLDKNLINNGNSLIHSDYNKDNDYFLFRIDLDLEKSNKIEQLNLTKNEFEIVFRDTLTTEAEKYFSASDIDYKALKESVKFVKIEILDHDKKDYIFTLISFFLTSLIISVLFILFKKIK